MLIISKKNPLRALNITVFMRGQVFLLPVLYLFYQKNGLGLSDFFYFQSIVTFVSLLFYVPAGHLADIFSKKKILILSMLFALVRACLWLFWGRYWIVLTGEIAYALSRSFFAGIVDSYMCDYLRTQERQDKMTKCYGRLNFFMSLSSAVSALLGPLLLAYFSLNCLILLEGIFILIALCFLFQIPDLPVACRKADGLWGQYQHIIAVFRVVLQKNKLRVPMISSGLFTATTMLLVWCFQPLMQKSLLPIIFFGVISFMNHAIRALFSLYVQKIMARFSLQGFQILTALLFLTAILGLGQSFKEANMFLSIPCLLLACIATGCQLAYTVSAVSYVHSQIQSENRSLISNLNFMIAASLSSFILFLFKTSIQYMPVNVCLIIYAILFGFVTVWLKYLFKK